MKVGMIFAIILNAIILLMMCYTMKFDKEVLVVLTSLGMCAATGIYIIFDLVNVLLPELGHTDDYVLGTICLYLDVARCFYYTTRTSARI